MQMREYYLHKLGTSSTGKCTQLLTKFRKVYIIVIVTIEGTCNCWFLIGDKKSQNHTQENATLNRQLVNIHSNIISENIGLPTTVSGAYANEYARKQCG